MAAASWDVPEIRVAPAEARRLARALARLGGAVGVSAESPMLGLLAALGTILAIAGGRVMRIRLRLARVPALPQEAPKTQPDPPAPAAPPAPPVPLPFRLGDAQAVAPRPAGAPAGEAPAGEALPPAPGPTGPRLRVLEPGEHLAEF